MATADQPEILSIDHHSVSISHPGKIYFSQQVQFTKLDLIRYYLAVAAGALQGIQGRPIVLKRFVNGACLATGQPEPFYQKRAPDPKTLPAFLRTVTLSFPSGRTAEELIVDNSAALAWIVNLGCIELHPHAVRAADLDHPDELRIDLDPGPGVSWADVRTVALEVRAVLEANGLIGWPKTSGSRGMHINVRIEPRWSFTEVRRAALALAREVERRIPALASSKWWKEERHGVFLDYNQNAKDRTTASAYSVRPLPDARVSAPLTWDEVADANPADFTVLTMPHRFAAIGNPHAAMDQTSGSLDALLELAAHDEAQGIGDAPWPPHFAKAEGEAKRVTPSRAKSAKSATNKSSTTKAEASTVTDPTTPGSKPFADQLNEGFGTQRFRRRANPAKQSPDKPIPAKRTPKHPLLTIAQSPDKSAAEAGLARWKATYPHAASHLAEDDILVDRMRGSSTIWYRIRVNLRHIPEAQRPTQQIPDPDDDPPAHRKYRSRE